jgi:hypothetical protein
MAPGFAIFNILTLQATDIARQQRSAKKSAQKNLSLDFMVDDTRFTPRAWKTSLDFLGLNAR